MQLCNSQNFAITINQIMNIIVATSRGRGLQELSRRREDTILSVHPGAKLEFLEDVALSYLNHADDNTTTHVYFVAGLPDVTFRRKYSFFLRGRYRKYEEVIMPDSDVDEITRDIMDTFTCTVEKYRRLTPHPFSVPSALWVSSPGTAAVSANIEHPI